ncbi:MULTISPECIES: TIGR02444 family protein [unclassified Pseudomonas]|uniref:TIGR02444 family protein n=1 Tax=unclassified Pseudomonas TaxID=196821 RepID=UPI0035C033DC
MHDELWNHALALYARPGVENACLSLQELGGDVCLLLCATWLQRRQVPASVLRAQELRDIAEPWQRNVIGPLRALRREWRGPARGDVQLTTLRERVKTLELDAERTLLTRLQAHAQQWPASPGGPTGDWLEWLVPEQAGDHDALRQLRAAAKGLQDAVDGD